VSGGPFVLVVCDGWGENPDSFGNAIAAARTPRVDALRERWAWTTVAASGEAVGLPDGQQGNSEVGHLTIGAGRVLFQSLPRVTRDIAEGGFFANPVLVEAVERARGRRAALHVMGLISPGGVHSHMDHGLAVVELARRHGLERVWVHAFLDGRDEPPTSAAGFVRTFEDGLARIGVGRVATVSGRYYAMDRDRRWDRTARAYEVLEERYAAGVTDEFIEPVSIVPPGAERVRIEDGDSVIFFNFRPDRARQITHALVDEDFSGFERSRRVADLHMATLTEYEAGLAVEVAYPPEEVRETLGEVVSAHGLRQFHVAETEKYAHVTYFINGGREPPLPGEDRLLVPSPKVATYDAVPAMSAEPVTEAVLDRIRAGGDALIVVNFANPDMVGHTGDLDATIVAVEVVLITADHGNAELKIDRRDGSPLTAHTTSPVPVILCGDGCGPLRAGGGLADIAPTVLGVLGLPVPAVMTGRDLRETATDL
jgi:2,3-bisphosphoglycerate-independent phosphoglycerate mutase